MQWEYHVFTVQESGWVSPGAVETAPIHEQLNALGKQGWELVAAFVTGASASHRECVFLLKRPIGR
jgi:hypothetical protein